MSFENSHDGWIAKLRARPEALGISSIQYLPVYLAGALLGHESNGDAFLYHEDWRRLARFERTYVARAAVNFSTVFTATRCVDPVSALPSCLDAIELTEPCDDPFPVPQLRGTDLEIADVIELVSSRPGMYLGELSAAALYAYMSGFVSSVRAPEEKAKTIDDFQVWHGVSYRVEPLATWLHLAWLYSGIPGDLRCLDYWNDFLATRKDGSV